MAEIKVNMENLKDNEREQLLALIEKANKKPKRFKPEIGQHYFYIAEDTYVALYAFCVVWNEKPIDLSRYGASNCFETEEEARFEIERRKIVAELKIFALENNDEMDWGDDNQYKYYLYYDYKNGTLDISFRYCCRNQGDIYFSSRELCEQATEKVGKDRIKKYLFGV